MAVSGWPMAWRCTRSASGEERVPGPLLGRAGRRGEQCEAAVIHMRDMMGSEGLPALPAAAGSLAVLWDAGRNWPWE